MQSIHPGLGPTGTETKYTIEQIQSSGVFTQFNNSFQKRIVHNNVYRHDLQLIIWNFLSSYNFTHCKEGIAAYHRTRRLFRGFSSKLDRTLRQLKSYLFAWSEYKKPICWFSRYFLGCYFVSLLQCAGFLGEIAEWSISCRRHKKWSTETTTNLAFWCFMGGVWFQPKTFYSDWTDSFDFLRVRCDSSISSTCAMVGIKDTFHHLYSFHDHRHVSPASNLRKSTKENGLTWFPRQ